MKIVQLVQGSDAWRQFRLEHFGASEAAAMLGLSKNTTRTELLTAKATRMPKEFDAWVQEKILDHGHEVEALARPIIEAQIADDLYPVTCEMGRLCASCDGLTLGGELAFEHKQWNASLAEAVAAGIVPDDHMPQCQQILLVTGADKVLFVVSDGTETKMVQAEVLPDPIWFERIERGWEQFEADLKGFVPPVVEVKPIGRAPSTLPALRIEVRGEVTDSNLEAFKLTALTAIRAVNRDLQTDQDFEDAAEAVKWCEEVETRLKAGKEHALSQTESIDLLFKTVDEIIGEARRVRLDLDKLVDARKASIKAEINVESRTSFSKHLLDLEAELDGIKLPSTLWPDFAAAMKNKRSVATQREACNTALANAKIAASTSAAAVRIALKMLTDAGEEHQGLFADRQVLVFKAADDLKLTIDARIAKAKADAEAKRAADEAKAAAVAAAPAPAPVVAAPPPAPVGGSVRYVSAAPAGAPSPDAPTITVGQINAKLAPVSIDAAGLITLGFARQQRPGSGAHFLASDMQRIRRAIAEHVLKDETELVAA